ncbi:hypothetical protein [Archangium lansingense]|uniref:Uncharacterized protein n=1 Tax=Archangium lansingense TaxID=2995310 RepID=A0ABT4AP62_9BACT|nr:hypothetical protein [Archangium lansinium]MCY1083498.1 hypothetical protein [Archangium lansinium]
MRRAIRSAETCSAWGSPLGYAFRVNAGLRVMSGVVVVMPVEPRVQGQWVLLMNGEPNLQPGLAFLLDPVR